MPSIFYRLSLYCAKNNQPLLTKGQRSELGIKISHYYLNNQQEFPYPLYKVPSVEPEGIFTVKKYPKQFNDKMDELIREFCLSKTASKVPTIITTQAKRKRLPLNSNTKITTHG